MPRLRIAWELNSIKCLLYCCAELWLALLEYRLERNRLAGASTILELDFTPRMRIQLLHEGKGHMQGAFNTQ